MCVLLNKILLKSIVFTVCEHKYMNICPSIIVLPAPLGNVYKFQQDDGLFNCLK